MPVIVVTRLRLREAALLDEFFTHAVTLVEHATKSEGNLGVDALAEAHVTVSVRQGCERQHPGWGSKSAGRCSGGGVRGDRQHTCTQLHPVRYHGAILASQAGQSVQEPRQFRERVGALGAEPGQSGLPPSR